MAQDKTNSAKNCVVDKVQVPCEVSSKNWPKLIGLYAPAPQSGKTTVTTFIRALMAEYEHAFEQVKLAGPLKEPLYKMGLTPMHIEGEGKDIPLSVLGEKSPREFMIARYKSMAAKEGADWLAKYGRNRIEKALESGKLVVVDDVRTPADYDMLMSFEGSELWRIERPSQEDGSPSDVEHLLEDKEFSRKIMNDSTLTALREQVAKVFI
jgi:hypothetical protein